MRLGARLLSCLRRCLCRAAHLASARASVTTSGAAKTESILRNEPCTVSWCKRMLCGRCKLR